MVTYQSISLADQTKIPNYNKARDLLWSQLYPSGGYTLYCGQAFDTKDGLNVEHIYPASWVSAHLGCGTRDQCRQTSERFNRIEADLHNLWPLRTDVNRKRLTINMQISLEKIMHILIVTLS